MKYWLNCKKRKCVSKNNKHIHRNFTFTFPGIIDHYSEDKSNLPRTVFSQSFPESVITKADLSNKCYRLEENPCTPLHRRRSPISSSCHLHRSLCWRRSLRTYCGLSFVKRDFSYHVLCWRSSYATKAIWGFLTIRMELSPWYNLRTASAIFQLFIYLFFFSPTSYE